MTTDHPDAPASVPLPHTGLSARPPTASFQDALWFWLKLGFISFGGPAGQIALMHTELVERRRWISERRFLHALNYCMLLPGPEAQQLATYIGWLLHRTWGGVLAGGLFVLPSLFILIGLSWVYIAWGDVPLIAGLFYGIKPAVAAIVLHAAHRIGSRVLKNSALWMIAAAAFVAIFTFNVPFPIIVAAAAGVGFLGGRLRPASFHVGARSGAGVSGSGAALIDDLTPTPAHAQFRWSRLVGVVAIGFALWAVPMAILVMTFGWQGIYTQMAWFFTKAAYLTFGGAYAVLPYIYQGAVDHYAWLTPVQMIDGLALGETTPGPLIMVVAYVGFIGGYLQPLLAPEMRFIAGACAAALVTWFTFLPSFLFILAGGPLVEATKEDLTFTAPLTAMTAAVVGVILNLAVFFGYHVLWPQGLAGHIDWGAAAIALGAGVALFRFRWGVINVIAACAMVGLILKLAWLV